MVYGIYISGLLLQVVLPVLLLVGTISGCAPTPGVLDRSLERQYPVPASPRVVDGSIYGHVNLFEDVRARSVGDILVVQLIEQTAAEKSSSTSINRKTSAHIDNPLLAGQTRVVGKDSSLDFDLDSNHEFAGGSGSDQSNSLTGSVAVTVTQILPGGNLLIEGEKWISINRGREFLRLRGVVRPIDVGLNNIIASTRIANAEITYSGTGETANANAPGWLARILMGRIWPF